MRVRTFLFPQLALMTIQMPIEINIYKAKERGKGIDVLIDRLINRDREKVKVKKRKRKERGKREKRKKERKKKKEEKTREREREIRQIF